jgi:hypothetical protein
MYKVVLILASMLFGGALSAQTPRYDQTREGF